MDSFAADILLTSLSWEKYIFNMKHRVSFVGYDVLEPT